MKQYPTGFYHRLYGPKKPRVVYYKKDFIDYVAMVVLSAMVTRVSYGAGHFLSLIGYVLCGLMIGAFIVRHGIEYRIPLFLNSPKEILYLLIYKIQNLRPVYFMALGLFLLENVLIWATPGLPH